VERGVGARDPRSAEAAFDRAEGERDDSPNPRDQGQAGGEVPTAPSAPKSRLTETEIALALKASEGNLAIAAAALGCSKDNIVKWIDRTPRLRALYGDRTEHTTKAPVAPPTPLELMGRTEDKTPPGIGKQSGINLTNIVDEEDAKMLLEGLRAIGLPEKDLKRIKDLSALAKSNGHFIASSLQTTHRSYFVQVMELTTVARNLKERYLDDVEEDDKDNPGTKKMVRNNKCSDEERAYFYKCYTEMVKEAGRAYEIMMNGAQAMIRMLQAAGSDGDDDQSNAKPAWHKRTAKEKKGR
jgi:hypothetical protein